MHIFDGTAGHLPGHPRLVYKKLSMVAFLGDKVVVSSLISQGADVNDCDF